MPGNDLPSPFKSLSPSLDVFADNWKVLLGSTLLHELLPGVPLGIGGIIAFILIIASGGDKHPMTILVAMLCGIVAAIIATVIMAWLTVGYLDICAGAVSGARPRTGLLFGGMDRAGNFLALMFLQGSIIMIGCLFLVLPGIYLALRLSFAPYSVVYQRMGPIEALKDSWQLTDAYQWPLLLFWAAFLAIGAVVLSIPLGSLIYAPYVNLCYITIYQMLLEMRPQSSIYR